MKNVLFDKTYIGKMKLKNRVFMSPMGTTGEADGAYNIDAINYFMERAKGGAGLIITGANVVSTKYEPRPCTELSDFHHVERLNMLIDRCHHYGAKVCVQLSPGLGRQQFTDPFTPPYSAGSVGSFWFPDLICKPFTKEDIQYLVGKVGYSASLAVMAGADAVELHAYGGYLLDQFQSKQWNNRTDEYGGSLENRMRFTLECIEAIKKNIPDTVPLLVKFTPDQRVEGFRDLSEGIEMAKILEKAGVDALHVDTGCYEEWYQAITTVYSKPGHKLDVQKAIKNTITLDYGEVTDISPDIRLTLHNAGHILGSAMSHMHIGDGAHNLVYTGDFKYERSRLLEPATTRFPRSETVIMESTYGGREDVQPSRNSAEKEMMKTIYKTLKRGGKVLVPVFAVGRAQELMVVLEEYMRHGMIEEVPIYIDGMIWEATAIHTARPEYLSKDLRDQIFHMGRNPFISDMFLKVQSLDQRKELVESKQPAIILSTSGMLTGGNSVEYFKWLCEDERNTLIFVGYQSEGSLGRRIQKGWKEVPLEEDGKTKVFNVKMEIKTINGFSGHSNRRQLMDYVKRLNPRPEKVITCHGDPYKTVDLASSVHRSYKIETKTPLNLDCVRIQ